MSAPLALRPYQGEALEAIRGGWAEGLTRVAVVLPTGMGKTVVFAHLIAREFERRDLRRFKPLILVHRDELVRQSVDKLRSVAPHLSVGVTKAERREVDADVLIGSVQTLARKSRRDELPRLGLVVVDECHHAAADSYLNILWDAGCFDEVDPTPAVGFTATLSRGDDRGLGGVWEKVVYRRDVLFGIHGGYLADVRGLAVEVNGLDLASVARSRGDFLDGGLGAALTASGAGEVIARAYAEHASDRSGVLFAPTVAAAYAFAEDLNATGIVTEVIEGGTPLEERRLTLKRFAAGEVQLLSNCAVLTEGWDAPWASCAVIARPTLLPGLYTQMAGRVLRPHPGKVDALILDVVGVAGKHRLASIVDLSDGEIVPEPGESLREAVYRRDREKLARGKPAGAVGYREVDLFHDSRSAWLQTPGGVWFIPTREHTFFLWPDEGTWKVGRCGVYSTSGGTWLKDGLPMEYAMAWAEQLAEETDPSISRRTASWRVRGAAPSQKQLDLARQLGIDPTGLSRPQLSDRISIHYAAKILDRR